MNMTAGACLVKSVCTTTKSARNVIIRNVMRTRNCTHDEVRNWVITAVSKLSGQRETISGVMTRTEAMERLDREMASRRHQRYKPYQKLRVEWRQPEELTLRFEYD